jgi:probable HAF family extracellular repeat protein
MRLSRLICATFALAVSLVGISTAAQYSIKDLGDLGTGGSAGNALNNRGEVVGQASSFYAQTHAFLYSHGRIQELSVLQGGNSWAYGINNKGHFVGQTLVLSGNNRYEHAFLDFSDLGAAMGVTNSGARDINDFGDVVGSADSGAYLYSKGRMRYLDANNENGSTAYGMNNRGDVVGEIGTPDGYGHAFIYTSADSALMDMQTLGGPYSGATDINDSGVVVGYSDLDNAGHASAFVWKHGTMIPLPTLGGNGVSANAINNRGDIVGFSMDGSNKVHVVMWDSTGAISDLTNLLPPSSGWVLQFANDINDRGQITGQGTHNGKTHAFLISPPQRLRLIDTRGEPIKHDSIQAYKVNKVSPTYPTSAIGTFVTDDSGLIDLPTDSLEMGDWVKMELKVATKPFYKHISTLGTRNAIYLDNEQIDSLGVVTWDSLNGSAQQTIILDHQTITYNCVVSIEWDADDAYLSGTEGGFQRMSDYLYDVSNGQMRLDTVMIFSNRAHWDEADYQVHASNMVWPEATNVDDFKRATGHIALPRKWFGNRDNNRKLSFLEDPLDLTQSIDYRTRCHEFGHYALGFEDEYNFSDWTTTHQYGGDTVRCSDASAANYGLMDCQYRGCEPYNQEMSSLKRYVNSACHNNVQWRLIGASCWDYTKAQFHHYDNRLDVFLPLNTPEDLILPARLDYLPGPNSQMLNGALDYDVGTQVHFPVSHPAAIGRTVVAHVIWAGNWPSANANVVLSTGQFFGREMDEGNCDDNGDIRILGYEDGDRLLVAFGNQAQVTSFASAGVSSNRVWASGSGTVTSGDSMLLDLRPVSGEYPLVCGAELDSTTCTLRIASSKQFSSLPTVNIVPSGGTIDSQTFVSLPGGYTTLILEDLGGQGTLRLNAVDDSGSAFFLGTSYSITQFDSTAGYYHCFGPDGSSELSLDTTNSSIKRLMLLSTVYPTISSGLETYALSAGPAVSVSAYPASALYGGNLMIHFDSSELGNLTNAEIQASLKLFRWDDQLAKWLLVGGNVDTLRFAISGQISQSGVYAAFTTTNPTGIDDDQHGRLLPKQFELGQNYPNPFNPSTTISFALPERTHVVLDIYNVLGQRIRGLLDESETAGIHSVVWDGRDGSEHTVSSGVYFYRITTEKFSASRKMLLLK